MNHHSDIRSLFLPWAEQKLNKTLARQIEEHLDACGPCKRYFDMMSSALLPGESALGGLIPDPYLPVRIRAHAEEFASFPPSGKGIVVRWSLRTMAIAAAIIVGIYIGETLATQPSVVTDQHVIFEYSNYLGASGIGDRWQTVTLVSEAVSK